MRNVLDTHSCLIESATFLMTRRFLVLTRPIYTADASRAGRARKMTLQNLAEFRRSVLRVLDEVHSAAVGEGLPRKPVSRLCPCHMD